MFVFFVLSILKVGHTSVTTFNCVWNYSAYNFRPTDFRLRDCVTALYSINLVHQKFPINWNTRQKWISYCFSFFRSDFHKKDPWVHFFHSRFVFPAGSQVAWGHSWILFLLMYARLPVCVYRWRISALPKHRQRHPWFCEISATTWSGCVTALTRSRRLFLLLFLLHWAFLAGSKSILVQSVLSMFDYDVWATDIDEIMDGVLLYFNDLMVLVLF